MKMSVTTMGKGELFSDVSALGIQSFLHNLLPSFCRLSHRMEEINVA
jgi:hypothetical protein